MHIRKEIRANGEKINAKSGQNTSRNVSCAPQKASNWSKRKQRRRTTATCRHIESTSCSRHRCCTKWVPQGRIYRVEPQEKVCGRSWKLGRNLALICKRKLRVQGMQRINYRFMVGPGGGGRKKSLFRLPIQSHKMNQEYSFQRNTSIVLEARTVGMEIEENKMTVIGSVFSEEKYMQRKQTKSGHCAQLNAWIRSADRDWRHTSQQHFVILFRQKFNAADLEKRGMLK